jgi:acyl carrier protein
MTDLELKTMVQDVLGSIAPEADFAALRGDDDLRETLDLDSMDFLNFIIALHERTGAEIPEADYPELFTLDGTIAYLKAHAGKAEP